MRQSISFLAFCIVVSGCISGQFDRYQNEFKLLTMDNAYEYSNIRQVAEFLKQSRRKLIQQDRYSLLNKLLFHHHPGYDDNLDSGDVHRDSYHTHAKNQQSGAKSHDEYTHDLSKIYVHEEEWKSNTGRILEESIKLPGWDFTQSCNGVNNNVGTCCPQETCLENGGTVIGSCAGIFNKTFTCCMFSATCNAQISRNNTYFQNPNYPNGYMGEGLCSVEYVTKSEVCQLKLELDVFRIRGPSNGHCNYDSLVIKDQNLNSVIPELCGVNNDQHLFVEVSNSEALQIIVLTSASGDRKWSIKLVEVKCKDTHRSTPYCLQYHSGTTGAIQSFNYVEEGALFPGTTGYQNNLNYAICIRKERGYCSIVYSNVKSDGSADVFEIVNVRPVVGFQPVSTLNANQAGADIKDCPDDFLYLSKGLRLCGQRLNDASMNIDRGVNSPVTDNAYGPYVLHFVTNQDTTGRGFSIYYRQLPCYT